MENRYMNCVIFIFVKLINLNKKDQIFEISTIFCLLRSCQLVQGSIKPSSRRKQQQAFTTDRKTDRQNM